MSGSHFEREIREQPEVLARLIESGRGEVEAIAEIVRAADPAFVVIAARGSSDNAARYAQYVLGAHNRLTVALAAPSLFTLYEAPPVVKGAAVIAISQSGESPDIVAVVEESRRQGAVTIAITNEEGSPLARAASACLTLRAGEERAVAATKTYTTELVALAMLSAALEREPLRWTELAAIPEAIETTLQQNRTVTQLARSYRDAERFVVLGRGFNHSTAFEIALKMKETSYVVAEPYSWADFRHGPIAVVDAGFPVVLVAPTGRVFGDVGELLELIERRGARLVAISDREDLLGRARSPLPLPVGVPEWLSPIGAVVPGQLWSLGLAIARGIDPDKPRGLSKVTHTR